MKKNIGIWIDTNQAIIINLLNDHCGLKRIQSNIDTRERVPGEAKKYGRFGGQYTTYEKNRLNKKNEQTNQYFKALAKEISNCNNVVLFGPSTIKILFEKEIKNNLQIAHKLLGVYNSEALTENQMIAWVKDFYKK